MTDVLYGRVLRKLEHLRESIVRLPLLRAQLTRLTAYTKGEQPLHRGELWCNVPPTRATGLTPSYGLRDAAYLMAVACATAV
jgi:hypothetical protein